LNSPGVPAVLELVAPGFRVGVADLPEALNEGVALVVLLDRQESGAFLLGDEQRHLLEPGSLLGGEPLELLALDLFLALGVGAGRNEHQRAQGE
jgi:hypothetical protein